MVLLVHISVFAIFLRSVYVIVNAIQCPVQYSNVEYSQN